MKKTVISETKLKIEIYWPLVVKNQKLFDNLVDFN